MPPASGGPQSNQNIANPTLTVASNFAVSPGDTLTLVWSDEFDGAALDPEVWFFATGDGSEVGLPGGWGNNELQYYLPDSAQLVNGVLKITARQETIGGLNYTSARINTSDRFAFRYGRIEASIKLPSGQGLWPAFWMLSQDSPYGTWAATGEIDIMEAVNLDGTGGNEIFGTIHYGGEFPNNVFTGETYTPSVDVTADFNTYALEWDPDEIRWYFNDTMYAVQNDWFSTAAPFPAPFDQPFHILLNLAVGGNFPGFGIDANALPATMEVDWVRVYTGEDSGAAPTAPGAAAPTPSRIQADVISLFSDAYTDVAVDTFLTVWSSATLEDTTAGSDPVKKYGNLDFAGIEFAGANAIDATGMTHFHMDVWTPDATSFSFKFVDFGGDGFGGGNDTENVPIVFDAASTPALAQGAWVSIDVSLADLQAAGLGSVADLNQLVIIGQPTGTATVFVDNMYFYNDAGGGGGGGTGNFVNGDFETGDFTGWTLTRVPDTRGSIALDTSGQGSRAGTVARLMANGDATGTNDVLISQVALAAGSIAPGDSIDVSFDLFGSLSGAGGVVFVEVIFLNGAGEDEGGRDFVGPAAPYTPTGTWTTHSGTVIAGTAVNGSQWDVSGGVTLQLKAACGAIAGGCGVDASFDNVTFTIN